MRGPVLRLPARCRRPCGGTNGLGPGPTRSLVRARARAGHRHRDGAGGLERPERPDAHPAGHPGRRRLPGRARGGDFHLVRGHGDRGRRGLRPGRCPQEGVLRLAQQREAVAQAALRQVRGRPPARRRDRPHDPQQQPAGRVDDQHLSGLRGVRRRRAAVAALQLRHRDRERRRPWPLRARRGDQAAVPGAPLCQRRGQPVRRHAQRLRSRLARDLREEDERGRRRLVGHRRRHRRAAGSLPRRPGGAGRHRRRRPVPVVLGHRGDGRPLGRVRRQSQQLPVLPGAGRTLRVHPLGRGRRDSTRPTFRSTTSCRRRR